MVGAHYSVVGAYVLEVTRDLTNDWVELKGNDVDWNVGGILTVLDNVALVLEHLDEKKSISIKKLKNKTSLSVEDIMAIVTLLLKYGYINIKD